MPSVALARTREALHIGWDKNDPKYAQVILHMLKIGATQTCCDSICSGINDIPGAHAVIRTGSDYRPFFEGPMPSGRTSLSRGAVRGRDPATL